MKSNMDQQLQGKHQITHKRVGDNLARGITNGLVRFLTKLCVWSDVTLESIKKQKPGARGNTPPPSGGISS